jgi:histidine triad (HIT) family protein
MYNHAPDSYDCPFCDVVQRVPRRLPHTQPEDIVLQNDSVTAFISDAWWPNNPGHIIIISNKHFENIYDLPLDYAIAIHEAAQVIALALKSVYDCSGVSTRQHNEPSGGQDVWHYHLHIFPRYIEDDLYALTAQRRTTTPEERQPYASRIRLYLASLLPEISNECRAEN